MRGKTLAVLVACRLIGPGSAQAEVRLASPFGDHMVLQQGMAVPVWGQARPGERISVSLGSIRKDATAGRDGRWQVRLSGLKTGGPYELIVKGDSSLTIKDVYVGEVWLCSGQSNMDMTVAREDRYWCGVMNEEEEVKAADYPLIREFRVKPTMTDEPQTEVVGQWSVCSPATVGKFSATAYFFAREIHKKLGVPVGLLTSTYGASTAQAWMSPKALSSDPLFVPLIEAYVAARKNYDQDETVKQKYQQDLIAWEAAREQAKAEGQPTPRRPKDPNPHQDQHNPSVLYNGMIAPLVPYGIRGALWYQGESNYPTGHIYAPLMRMLIADWRQAWRQGEFPFLFVQLANHQKPATEPAGKSDMAPVRDGQLKTLRVRHTGMAVAIDIGDAENIHPKNKQEIGRRLGLVAQALVYRKPVPYSGPLYRGMRIRGSAIQLLFRHTEGGLSCKAGKLTGFAVAGEDRQFVWADAKIEGQSVVVSSPQIVRPLAVRYGWADNPPVCLCNGVGLPASPFRTDNWDLPR
jgi:sialate O-acetylesterase